MDEEEGRDDDEGEDDRYTLGDGSMNKNPSLPTQTPLMFIFFHSSCAGYPSLHPV